MVVIIASQRKTIVDSRRQLLLKKQNYCLKLSLVLLTHTLQKNNPSMYISK